MNGDEIHRAAQVHYSFLPEHYANSALDIAVKARPLNILGGDYCSVYPLDDDCVLVCMCDAVGHGIASALFASRINTFVLSQALHKRCPCHMIESLNEHLCQRMSSMGMYTSFFSIFVDTRKQELIFAGAGHPAALYYHSQNGMCEPLESVTTMLGISHPLLLSCSVTYKKLQVGDKVVLYTDGLIESRDNEGREFGMDGLMTFIKTHHPLNSSAFNKKLFEITKCDSGLKVRDDILLLTMTII